MSTMPTDLPGSIAATSLSQHATGKQLRVQRDQSLRVQLGNERDVLNSSDEVDVAHQPSATGDGQAEGRTWWSTPHGGSPTESAPNRNDRAAERDKTGLRIDLHG